MVGTTSPLASTIGLVVSAEPGADEGAAPRPPAEGSTEPEPGSASWWDAHLRRLDRRRPRSGGLTVERIVDEALALADAEGLDALTVRSLAARLGTSSATLYRHVASVDELLVLMIDRVLVEIEAPDTELAPRRRLVLHAHRFRNALLAHPGVVPALRSATLLGPNARRVAAAGLESLFALGFPASSAVAGYLAMIDYVLGAVFFDTASVTDSRVGQIDADTAPVLVDHRDLFLALTSDAVFHFGLESLVDGLLLRLDRGGSDSAGGTVRRG